MKNIRLSAYYIEKGLKKRWYAMIFAIAIIGQFGMTNNMVQANTITSAFNGAFGVDPYILATALTVLTVLVIFGGIQRIAKVCSVVIPFMALGYLAIAIWVIATNITAIPSVLSIIVKVQLQLTAINGIIGMQVRQVLA